MFPPPLKTCHPERSEGSVVRSEIVIGMPRAGMAQNWRPTFHLSTAGCNQRNYRTDRLAWEHPMDCPPINGSAAAFEKPGEKRQKERYLSIGYVGRYPQICLKKRSRPSKHYYSGGFSLLSPKPFRGYTPYKIGVVGSRIPLDNPRRMYAFVGGPRRTPLADSPIPGNPNG